jgi:excisionase family DNA binding protein
MMTDPITQGWITTTEAATVTGYKAAYVRYLANQGLIEARKVGRDWLINQESLLAYKTQMDALGPQRHNPWREGLAQQGRGRNKSANQPTDKPITGGNQ